MGAPEDRLRYLWVLGADGSLRLLSPPRLAARGGSLTEPAAAVGEPLAASACAASCSREGSVLVAAGREHVSVYTVEARLSASLLWRVPFNAVPRAVAVCELGGTGVATSVVVAVGSSMGLLLLSESDACAEPKVSYACGAVRALGAGDATDGRGGSSAVGTAGCVGSRPIVKQLLLRGLPVCTVAMDAASGLLVTATLDGAVFCAQIAGRGAPSAGGNYGSLLRPMWLARLPPQVERPCTLAFTAGYTGDEVGPCAPERVAVGGWLGHVAILDCTTSASPPSATHPLQPSDVHGPLGTEITAYTLQNWRLMAVHEPGSSIDRVCLPPPDPAPALVAACRAPHARALLLASPGVRASEAAPSKSHRLAFRGLPGMNGSPPPRLPARVGQAHANEVRGLCIAPLALAQGRAEDVEADVEGSAKRASAEVWEVACWLECDGGLHCATLWPWLSPRGRHRPGEDGTSAARLLPRAYSPKELLEAGWLRVGGANHKDGLQLCFDMRAVAVPRDSAAVLRQWLESGQTDGSGSEDADDLQDAPLIVLGDKSVALLSAGVAQLGDLPTLEARGLDESVLREPDAPPVWESWITSSLPAAAAIIGRQLLLLRGNTLHCLAAAATPFRPQTAARRAASVHKLELPITAHECTLAHRLHAALVPDAGNSSRFALLLSSSLPAGPRARMPEYTLVRGEVADGGGLSCFEPLRLRAPWIANSSAPRLVGAAGDALLFEHRTEAPTRWTACDSASGAFHVIDGPPPGLFGLDAVRAACAPVLRHATLGQASVDGAVGA
mgnify:CR=1 FL=1